MSSDTLQGSATEGIPKRRVAALIARRRQNIDTDGYVPEYTFINSDGDKIHRIEFERKDTGTVTVETNFSKMFAAAPSTTSNIDILWIEAEQAAEASADELERMNPHIPSNDEVLEQAVGRIEDEGLIPAWEVVDGE